MDISRQRAEAIVNIEYNEAARRDHLASGIALLRQAHYPEAHRELSRAIEEDPVCEVGHYYVALALLNGMRPSQRPRAVLDRVRNHLQTARTMPEACALLLIVEEDDGLRWRRFTNIPRALYDLVARIDSSRMRELLLHVPARETRTYQVIEAALIKNESDRS